MLCSGPRPFGLPTARKVVDRRHGRSFTGWFPTPKGGGLVPFESLLEADLVELMASDPSVASIHAQPETFAWRERDRGRRRRYTPDFLATMVDGRRVYREVKPFARIMANPDFSGRRSRIEAECASRGATFEVWTEKEIRVERNGWKSMRVAAASETTIYTASAGDRAPRDDGLVRKRPGDPEHGIGGAELADVRTIGGLTVGRSRLTGIVMVRHRPSHDRPRPRQ